jgi:hypothetical protein
LLVRGCGTYFYSFCRMGAELENMMEVEVCWKAAP